MMSNLEATIVMYATKTPHFVKIQMADVAKDLLKV